MLHCSLSKVTPLPFDFHTFIISDKYYGKRGKQSRGKGVGGMHMGLEDRELVCNIEKGA